MELNISERVIEDIFSVDKSIISEVLNLNYSDLNILARQKTVKSGIIDLLYLWKDELILIELKAVPFYKEIIEQIDGYYDDLIKLQNENKLIKAPIRKIILVISSKGNQNLLCKEKNIDLLVYNPKTVLSRYYENPFSGLKFKLRGHV
jgi:hypothetical protein